VRAKAAVVALFALVAPASARGAGDPAVAALQSALRTRGLYAGVIDGVRGPATDAAVVRAQRRAALVADGVVGPLTRRALRLHALGWRTLRARAAGPDVVALQFALSERGFPCGTIDGDFGARTERAVRRFQRYAGLSADGVAGRQTFLALRAPVPHPPLSLSWPLAGVLSDGFGPRSGRFHTGVDIAAPMGASVRAAGPGRVAYAAELVGGWGLLVSIAHGGGVRTLYAHLSRIDVLLGQRVQTGAQVGLVGATGHATGPHLHFEVRVDGAAVDPLGAL
jgi:murein DD-endopeptidase MepM/ murein hydrolase activator NlpD